MSTPWATVKDSFVSSMLALPKPDPILEDTQNWINSTLVSWSNHRVWKLTTNGIFLVRSLYSFLINRGSNVWLVRAYSKAFVPIRSTRSSGSRETIKSLLWIISLLESVIGSPRQLALSVTMTPRQWIICFLVVVLPHPLGISLCLLLVSQGLRSLGLTSGMVGLRTWAPTPFFMLSFS